MPIKEIYMLLWPKSAYEMSQYEVGSIFESHFGSLGWLIKLAFVNIKTTKLL